MKPAMGAAKIIKFQDFFGHHRRKEGHGKTLTFYFTKADLATFKKLQRWLQYRKEQTRALRAMLTITFLVVSKIYEGYSVTLEKRGKESLTLRLFD